MRRHVFNRALTVLTLLAMYAGAAWPAEPLRVVVNIAAAPYVISDMSTPTDVSGLDVEILRPVFKAMGRDVTFIAVPRARVADHMISTGADAAMTYPGDLTKGLCWSPPYRSWMDAAIVLADSKIQPDKLGEARLASFPGAVNVLSGQLAPFMPAFETVTTVQRSDIAARAMLSDRFDAFLGDLLVFRHYLKRVTDRQIDVAPAYWFKPVMQSLVFADETVCKNFGTALLAFQQSDGYAAILKGYGVDDAHLQSLLTLLKPAQ